MVNLGIHAAHGTNDGDDVEAPRAVRGVVFQVMVDGLPEVASLLKVDGLEWVGEIAVVASLHFYEDEGVAVLGNDVDVAVAGTPVTVQDDIPLFAKVGRGELFAPVARLQVLGAVGRRSVSAVVPPDECLASVEGYFHPSFFVGHIGQHPLQGEEDLFGFGMTFLKDTLLQHVHGSPEHGERGAWILTGSIEGTDGLVSLFYSSLFAQIIYVIYGHKGQNSVTKIRISGRKTK